MSHPDLRLVSSLFLPSFAGVHHSASTPSMYTSTIACMARIRQRAMLSGLCGGSILCFRYHMTLVVRDDAINKKYVRAPSLSVAHSAARVNRLLCCARICSLIRLLCAPGGSEHSFASPARQPRASVYTRTHPSLSHVESAWQPGFSGVVGVPQRKD